MAKQVIHGEDSRQAILRGVNQLADALSKVVHQLLSRDSITKMTEFVDANLGVINHLAVLREDQRFVNAEDEE